MNLSVSQDRPLWHSSKLDKLSLHWPKCHTLALVHPKDIRHCISIPPLRGGGQTDVSTVASQPWNSFGNVCVEAIHLPSFNQTWQPDILRCSLDLYGLSLGIRHVFIVRVDLSVYLRTMLWVWLMVFGKRVGAVSEMISFCLCNH